MGLRDTWRFLKLCLRALSEFKFSRHARGGLPVRFFIRCLIITDLPIKTALNYVKCHF